MFKHKLHLKIEECAMFDSLKVSSSAAATAKAPFIHELRTISRESDQENVRNNLFTHAAKIRRLSMFTHIGNAPCGLEEGRHLGRRLH